MSFSVSSFNLVHYLICTVMFTFLMDQWTIAAALMHFLINKTKGSYVSVVTFTSTVLLCAFKNKFENKCT